MELIFTDKNLNILRKNIKMTSNQQKEADLLMENKLSLHSNLDILEFREGIDWSYQHILSPRTYQVYIHSLSYLNSALYIFEHNKQKEYYEKAEAVIESWLNYYLRNNDASNNIIWAEHAVANRLTTLLYFLSLKNESTSNYELILEVIYKHLDFLIDPVNYKETNHGLMMDLSILITSLFLNDKIKKENYITIARHRVEKLILRDFSYQGAHLENSPEYHMLVLKLLKSILGIFKELEINTDYRINLIIEKAKKYMSFIINSNNEIPLLGDTSFRIIKDKKSYNDYIDYEAGISVFNNKKNLSTLIFNCGFRNRGHKQRDDLSFIYSLKGQNIFTDGGKYSYDKSSDFVKFIDSALAHNTFTVRNFDYPLKINEKINLKTATCTQDYKYVVGEMIFEEIQLKRHLVLFDDDCIVIFDEGFSNKKVEWIQNFIFDEEVQLSKFQNKKLMIKTEKNNFLLKFIDSDEQIKTLFGHKEYACISKKFNELIDTYRIENISNGKKCSLVTLFTPSNKQEHKVQFQGKKLELIYKEKTIVIDLQ